MAPLEIPMTLASDPASRLARLRLSLDGLSIGDGFGEKFFRPGSLERLAYRQLPDGPWKVTDDTVMALSVCDVLEAEGTIDQERLAALFARRHDADPMRGYGAGAHDILDRISAGMAWRQSTRLAFDGQGSLGNGGAMRVAPLGAHFADDLDQAIAQAARSAEVTHAHPEGQAGAVAIAVAAALAAGRGVAIADDPPAFVREVAALTPGGATRHGLEVAAAFPADVSTDRVWGEVGNGSQVSAADTVPFCVWAAARFARSFEEALWETVSALGDRDTTCAIVGGVVALAVGRVPPVWLARREPLPWGL
jgi:ADP-ribosylglycohydrolase